MAAVTKSSSKGLDAYVRQVNALDGHGVKVGIQSDAGDEEGTSILDIAIYNEFGTETIPARPFIRDFAQKNEKVLGMAMERVAARVEKGGSVDAALATLGEFAQQHQQAHVRASKSWAEPNAKSTVQAKSRARKGGSVISVPLLRVQPSTAGISLQSDVPLIDHGVLVNAIRWEKT